MIPQDRVYKRACTPSVGALQCSLSSSVS